jgi:hypothetical protein
MTRGERRKCKSCMKLFRPDPRSRGRQLYCSAPRCKRASKAASQARWLAKPREQDLLPRRLACSASSRMAGAERELFAQALEGAHCATRSQNGPTC